MCAFRDFRSEQPHIIAQKYRLNHTKVETKHVLKRKPKEPDVPEITIELVDPDTNVQPSWLISDVSSDEDFDPFEEEDIFLQSKNNRRRSVHDMVKHVYETACKRHKIMPLNCVTKGLVRETLSCRFMNLKKEDCLCICYALCNDRFVERLDFQQNGMGPEPARFFAEVIENSSFLTHIRIVDNDLKSAGIRPICEAVRKNAKIECLDLSGNGLVESDGEYFENLIEEKNSLRELYLGHNQLMDHGVRRICEALKKNDTLEILDLSWNHIRLKGAEAIGEALEVNHGLLKVNLEWNGLYQDGAFSIAKALQKNDTLFELNLVCNRLSEYCIAEILKGLDSNSSLEILRIGQNQVTTRGAFSILKHIKENVSSKISMLDFGNQEVHDDFEKLYLELQKERDIKVQYGRVWQRERSTLSNSGTDEDEVALLSCNPLTVVMECMRLQNLRLIDFFKSLDTDRSKMISINELCDGLIKVGIPVRRNILIKLLTKLDRDNNGKLDYGEMVEAQNIHRNNLRKIFAACSDVEFENTEIGKVSIMVRKVMHKSYIMKSSVSDGRQKSAKERTTANKPRTPSPNLTEKSETSSPNSKNNERTNAGRSISNRGMLRASSASSDSPRSVSSGSSRVSSASSSTSCDS